MQFDSDQLCARLVLDDDLPRLSLQHADTEVQWGPAPLVHMDVFNAMDQRLDPPEPPKVYASTPIAGGVHLELRDRLHQIVVGLTLTLDEADRELAYIPFRTDPALLHTPAQRVRLPPHLRPVLQAVRPSPAAAHHPLAARSRGRGMHRVRRRHGRARRFQPRDRARERRGGRLSAADRQRANAIQTRSQSQRRIQ